MKRTHYVRVAIVLVVILISTILLLWSNKNRRKTEAPYSIVEKTFNKKNAEIPKVYIYSEKSAEKENYINAIIRVEDNSGQYENIRDAKASFKIRGNSTARGEKVPYNIKFDEKKNVLGMGESKKWCLLANLYDPTLLRNMIALDFARNIGLNYTSKCEFVELIYNGKTQGMYLMCTPVDEGKDKVDLKLSENDYLLQIQPNYNYTDKTVFDTNIGVIISIEEGNDKDLTYLIDFMKKFEESMGESLEAFSKYADVESFVDFYVLNEIVKGVDFATSSTYFYIKDDKMYAGPVWDFDLSMGNADKMYYPNYYTEGSDDISYEGIYCQKLWFMYLMKNVEFKDMVIKRFNELQPLIENLTTDNALGRNRIDNILDLYREDIDNNYSIWNVSKRYYPISKQPLGTYDENVEYLRQWLINRNEWLKNEWKNGTSFKRSSQND